MLTPQEVEERVFPKVKKGGYDMQDVDDFLDQLTADYTELYKENAALKRKMKVLADKITEYQETEGAMRQTLLAAQKTAAQIVAEAEEKRAKIMAETEQIARGRTDELSAQVAEEEARLVSAKRSVASLTANIRALLKQEEEFLDSLPADVEAEDPATPVAPTAVAADEVAAEIGASIGRMMDEEDAARAERAAAAPVVEEETPAEEVPAAAAPAAEEETPSEEPAPAAPADDIDDAPTRRLDLSELRFGRNYEIQ